MVSGVLYENLQEAAQTAMRREEALRLLLLIRLFFVLSLQSILEIPNTLTQAFRHLGDLLTAKQQYGDTQYDEQFRESD
jgi:hypothetical protein